MKKFSLLLASLLFAVCLAGCTEYRGPVSGIKPGDNPGNTQGTTPGNNPGTNPGDNPGGQTQENVFTVSLVYDGAPFVPENSKPVNACWYDINGFGVHTAAFNDKGVAEITGLDGDYRVTLSGLPVRLNRLGEPVEYTYNPNAYTVTNDDRSVNIELYEVSATRGEGTNFYEKAIEIDSFDKAYRAKVSHDGQTVIFRFIPNVHGVYSLTTFADVSANLINPVLYVYMGTVGYVNTAPVDIIDGGAEEGTFTKNVFWEMKIAPNFVGNVFIFALRAYGINESAFPIDIDFYLKREKDYIRDDDDIDYTPVSAKEEFGEVDWDSGRFNYIAYLDPNRLLDGKRVKLWKKEEGGDGYYHLYNEETGYGSKIYAKISSDTEGASTLTRTGFLDDYMSKKVNGKNYTDFINSYAAATNADGVYPVTEELKIFLQEFSIASGYFRDGNGWFEMKNDDTGFPGYNSSEANQWLFACGYYA